MSKVKKALLKISEMTGKLAGVDAINTDPLSNDFCCRMNATEGTICSKCYSISMLKTFRKNCRPAFQRNAEVLSSRPLTDGEILTLKFKNDKVRYNAHGELINVYHAINCIRIAQLFPSKQFALFTKRANLVKKAVEMGYSIPRNLHLIYSSAKINHQATKPSIFDKVFVVYSRDYDDPNVVINCCDIKESRKCSECKRCYTQNDCEVVNERIKVYTK